MARVYVSSTFKDLKDCREQVRAKLRRMDHLDVAMEYYVAEDRRPVDKCLADVESCDLYICLVAWRYGYIPPGHEHSITELEYRRAKESGKEVLGFLLDEDALWPPSRVDRDRDQVDAFRQTLQQEHTTAFFTGPADINSHLGDAIHAWQVKRGSVTSGDRTDWERYRGAVFEKHRSVRLSVIAGAEQDRNALIPLTDVFVAQLTTAERPTFDVQTKAPVGEPDPDESADAFQEPSPEVLGREPRQVILGGPGSGKSTLFHFSMLTLCDPVPSEDAVPPSLRHGPVPLLVELRQYVLDRKESKNPQYGFVEYLADRAQRFYGVKVEADDLRALLGQEGRAVVLFDGLDEILIPGERKRIAEQFDAFARQYPQAQIVVSSRIVGYDPEPFERFRQYTLLDFGLTEVRKFVPRWYQHYTWEGDDRDADGLLARIAENPRLLELAGNPLLLTMMAVLYKHQELPEKRWQLYQRCTKVLLEDWDVKRKDMAREELIPLDFQLGGDQKAEILQNVSMHMLLQHGEGGEPNAIQRQPLIRILADYLEKEYGKPPGAARAVATQIIDHLRERTYLLAEVGHDVFGFVHRTFMEYFAAAHALADFNQREADYDWLAVDVYGANWRKDEWQEVLLLLIAMLKDQGSPIEKVVDHLLGVKVVREPPWNLAFAARCLGEAGAKEGPWAQAILDQLVTTTLRWAGDTSGEDAAQFVEQALAAFSLIVPTVRPPRPLREKIGADGRRSRRHHTVAWQMELALRSREDRLKFALDGLSDKEEAVRTGAVAALEREWPGRADAGAALVEVLRSDRITRVRQAAIMALRRSWPEQTGILEAIAERANDETAYTHVEWLVDYVASEWWRDPSALDVVLDLAATKRRPHRPNRDAEYPYDRIVGVAGRAIACNWGDQPNVLAHLQARFGNEQDPHVRGTILVALAAGWPNADGLLGWLRDQLAGDSSPVSGAARQEVYWEVASGLAGQPTTLAWLQHEAMNEADPEARRAAFIAIVGAWIEDPEVRSWAERRATDDPSPVFRHAALRTITWQWPEPEPVDLLMWRQAVDDPDGDVRLLALAAAGGHMDATLLSEEALGLGTVSLLVSRQDRFRWIGRCKIVPLLKSRVVDDPWPVIRQAALTGILRYQGFSVDTVALLCSRLQQDPADMLRGEALLHLGDACFGGTTSSLAFRACYSLDRTWVSELFDNGHLLAGMSLERSSAYEDVGVRAALEHAAERDADAGIRTAATLAVASIWHDDPSVSVWLDERIRSEAHAEARAILEMIVDPASWESA